MTAGWLIFEMNSVDWVLFSLATAIIFGILSVHETDKALCFSCMSSKHPKTQQNCLILYIPVFLFLLRSAGVLGHMIFNEYNSPNFSTIGVKD